MDPIELTEKEWDALRLLAKSHEAAWTFGSRTASTLRRLGLAEIVEVLGGFPSLYITDAGRKALGGEAA